MPLLHLFLLPFALPFALSLATSFAEDASYFSATRAILFARFSQIAYCPSEILSEKWKTCPDCVATDSNFSVSRVIQGSKAQSQAFIGYSNPLLETLLFHFAVRTI
jgi:hypothetical protein